MILFYDNSKQAKHVLMYDIFYSPDGSAMPLHVLLLRTPECSNIGKGATIVIK